MPVEDRISADLIIGPAAQVATMVPTEQDLCGVVRGGMVACREGRIVAVGGKDEVLARVDAAPGCRFVEAEGKTVCPGFVDSHTHLVFAGWRAEEFEARLAGASYLDILRQGGGILSTVRATRMASAEELFLEGYRRLDLMLAHGSTTVEVKSGYGLDLETELKCLRVAAALRKRHPVEVVPTFLGAHALPPEYEKRADAYVDLVAREMIPAVAEEGLAEFVDAFCEEGVFSSRQCRLIFASALEHGLRVKLHADEFEPSGGAELAAEVGAVSADHLMAATREGLEAMAAAGVVAVLLPGTSFFLRLKRFAPAKEMAAMGLEVALATDFNPGSCTVSSMGLVMGMACLGLGMTPAEALRASTVGGAKALGRDQVGAIKPGNQADLVILDAPGYNHVPYRLGENLVERVFKRGVMVWERPGRKGGSP